MAASRASLVKRPPQQGRAQLTRGRLLDVAGELLAEVGIERISTNMIAARAGLTPPALYRYFGDKYAVLEALGRRLMERQNAVLEDWLARQAAEDTLLDQVIMAVSPQALSQFQARLDIPPQPNARLQATRPPPYSRRKIHHG